MNKECLYRIYNFHNELELFNLWDENVQYYITRDEYKIYEHRKNSSYTGS